MTKKIYQSVLERLKIEVPSLAEPLLNKALDEIGTNPSDVTAFQMKNAIKHFIEPVLSKNFGLKKGLEEIGTGIIVLDRKGKIRSVPPSVQKLFPEIKDKRFSIKKDLTKKVFYSKGRSIKILTAPIVSKSQEIEGGVCIVSDVTLDRQLENEMVLAYDRILNQNREATKKTMELNELKGKLEDKNYELMSAIQNLNEQNRNIIKRSLELTELQRDLEDKNYEVEKANEKVMKLMEARTEFVNRAAHDLRTPVTPILILIPEIKKRIKDKEILCDLSVIERNAAYLRSIANDLISYLKSQSGKYTYSFVKTSLNELVEDVLTTYKEAFKQNRISVEKKFQSILPPVELDVLKIAQVIQNIVSNALKFTPEGGRLAITAEKMDSFINIKFKDSGIGLSKKNLTRIFDEFFKVDKSRHSTGEGLGLSICNEVILNHNGRIWAESGGPGKGTTIAFEIPIKQKKGGGAI
ncbi:HAMP domain-containing histidine kinase [Candidatus Woesearchaeota archaeon]|nr:HAMP domain-containing histidine kinase [Candidatus Woesearchaeota archaeon]